MKKDNYKVAVLPGDGIGPEVVSQAVNVLQAVADSSDFTVELVYAEVGGIALEKYSNPLPAETLETCKNSDAVLLGAIGDPRWDNMPSDMRPGTGPVRFARRFGALCKSSSGKSIPKSC